MKKYLLIILTLMLTETVSADDWILPVVTDYYNSDSTFYVRIFPAIVPAPPLPSRFSKEIKLTKEDISGTPCIARMYMVAEGDDSLIWEQKLGNKGSPANALLSNDGKYFVTFDNCESLGYGDNVFTYYNEKGSLIRKYALEDISPYPLDTYKTTASSIWWACSHEFIDEHRISICFIDRNEVKKETIYNLEKQQIE